MKVWKMVKKTLPLVGTRPFFRISLGSIRTRALSSKAEKALYAWSARMFLSARKRTRGLDLPRNPGHGGASRRSPFEGLGTDAAEVAMATDSIVERLDVIEDVGA